MKIEEIPKQHSRPHDAAWRNEKASAVLASEDTNFMKHWIIVAERCVCGYRRRRASPQTRQT
ncbi:hypothetical protein CSQ95_27375 [Janthinobacterium sp. BJB304]|nr:hypothetical protein CSQ95_27375 [Janthinobacterium sp. BJB304]